MSALENILGWKTKYSKLASSWKNQWEIKTVSVKFWNESYERIFSNHYNMAFETIFYYHKDKLLIKLKEFECPFESLSLLNVFLKNCKNKLCVPMNG